MQERKQKLFIRKTYSGVENGGEITLYLVLCTTKYLLTCGRCSADHLSGDSDTGGSSHLYRHCHRVGL